AVSSLSSLSSDVAVIAHKKAPDFRGRMGTYMVNLSEAHAPVSYNYQKEIHRSEAFYFVANLMHAQKGASTCEIAKMSFGSTFSQLSYTKSRPNA
ncbi:MAG: hypothetical protein EBT13_18860, partial [Rhodobacteraceae bacterium]|nr:hypothetical protein [Paracoccaceae bacterium]